MVIVTFDEIAQYRAKLADNSLAQRSLDMLEDCEGDLEDAAIALALQSGQEPDRTERWLEGLAKRWRSFLCQSTIKQQLADGEIASVVQLLASETTMPELLATPVVIYVDKVGIASFCQPFEEKL